VVCLEVPTEDPTLAGKLAASMTRGIQEGDDPRYAKTHHETFSTAIQPPYSPTKGYII
jgi:hypothetical protein